MSKNKVDKKINKKVRDFNRELKKDVYNGRFWVRQYQKTRYDGSMYYLYELIDETQPERNQIIRQWIRGNSVFFMSEIWEGMNDFIIKSDFWENWRREKFGSE